MDDYTPRFAGDMADPLACTFTDSFGNPYNITGATITLELRNRSSGSVITGAGTWTIINAPQGQALYVWSAADVATPGLYDLSVKMQLPSGEKHFQTKPLEILPVW